MVYFEMYGSNVFPNPIQTIGEVLEASRKMEASLLKLQQMRKKATSDNDGKMSDDEKIRQQIRLDVAAFGEKVFDLGVEPQNQTYRSLHDLAHRS